MDLKFTFGGASPDHGHEGHDHGGAPSGIPLPFSTTPITSSSSVLDVRVRRSGGALLAEAVTGDGVVYCSAEVPAGDEDPAVLARTTRSALSRAVAGLEGPLAESISAVVLDLEDDGAAVLREFGIAETGSGSGLVDAALQRRIGVAAGTPIRLGA
ncbi:hypothetical protein [Leucobacter celer]|uniref:hypothetical protein n=1 Tax=Leucobacter celer TaxID=668625 RepID=UPI0006A78D6D|nr:hypothetical protein [Leucobacter celer]